MKIVNQDSMDIYQTIQSLLNKMKTSGFLDRDDEIFVRNQILELLGIQDYPLTEKATELEIPKILDLLVDFAVQRGVIEDFFDDKEVFSAKIMNCFVYHPSIINKQFCDLYNRDPMAATEYFYSLCKIDNYIQTERIAKNISFKRETEFGELDITINLSKPEKDPKEIERQKSVKASSYPKCLLCAENEGYAGHAGYPARSNHRVIKIDLENEVWFFQYSPYLYYNEHCIVLSVEHRDMKIDRRTFARILSFVEMFPHYFLGSNADLPIVGGSILSHDHYQGGRYDFAMAKAADERRFELSRFPEIQCSVVKWPMSVIRLRSKEKAVLVDASEHIFLTWKTYSDPEVEILAASGPAPHNTVTPIARRKEGLFEMDIVLRNNRTTPQYPLGIFHPHPDVQHIKKENIGLIEVMGLAVLPARLESELALVEDFLLGKGTAVPEYHVEWAKQLEAKYGRLSAKDVGVIVKNETSAKFLRVLEDAGVFKKNVEGSLAFDKFIKALD